MNGAIFTTGDSGAAWAKVDLVRSWQVVGSSDEVLSIFQYKVVVDSTKKKLD
jgi:hypothetical protein